MASKLKLNLNLSKYNNTLKKLKKKKMYKLNNTLRQYTLKQA